MSKYIIIPLIIVCTVVASCDNIFAPKLDDTGSSSIISDQIKKINRDIVSAMINLTCDIHDKFHELGRLGPVIYIREHEVAFPQIKPLRLLRSWSPNSIVDIINPEFFFVIYI